MNHVLSEPAEESKLDTPDESVRRTECYKNLMARFEEIEGASNARKQVIYRIGAVRDVWDNLPFSLAMAGFALVVGWFSSLIGLPGLDLLFTVPFFFDTVLRVTATSAGAVLTGLFALAVCAWPERLAFGFATVMTTIWWSISVVYLILEGRWGVLSFAAPSALVSFWASYLWFRIDPAQPSNETAGSHDDS